MIAQVCLVALLAIIDFSKSSFVNVLNDAQGDASIPISHNPSDLPFSCGTWSELSVGAHLGHGHVREAFEATFRGSTVVVKVPASHWNASASEQVAVFQSEIGRLLRLRASGLADAVPRLIGYCLDAVFGIAVVCERLVPWPQIALNELRWSVRVALALSAARMLKQWCTYVDYRGETSPRWFWDFSPGNVGVDLARRRVAIIDVESFTPYVAVRDHHDVSPQCKRDEQCVPRRLAKFHSPLLQKLSELQCDLDSRQCNGVLDDRTNVFRACLVILQPLFAHRDVPREASSEVRSILQQCLDYDHKRRSSSSELVQQLEALQHR